MRDRYGRTPLGQSSECLRQRSLGLGIDGARGLVENQHRGLGDLGARHLAFKVLITWSILGLLLTGVRLLVEQLAINPLGP